MFQRASGILLHPTSLPSRGGIGDFGPAAYEFIDFLTAGRQGLWQVLPLGPLGYGNSPYSATSAFAGNALLISLERLAERGWIENSRLAGPAAGSRGRVDYEAVVRKKVPLLREAAENFLASSRDGDKERFRNFCSRTAWWLEDFVLFDVLREKYGQESWNRWPRELGRRDPGTLERARQEWRAELEAARVLQFVFFEQWRALRNYARARGIRIIGDVAIFVNYDSADVWTHPDLFHLNHELEPEFVAGVPPDFFSASGQRWGNPLYRWEALKRRGYDWWVRRMRWALETCDILRLDHFRGFEKYWEIPASEETAARGRWAEGPKDDLFHVLRAELGELPLIAEDLGFITPEVMAMRERLGMPGMKVMQFGFGNRGAHIYLPHFLPANCVVYTGTHDNDTTVGWWKRAATAEEKRLAQAYVGNCPEGIHWAFIRAAQTSAASLCIVPLQDVLGLDSDARMNVPSRPEGNWGWRYPAGAATVELAERLATLAEVTDRDAAVSAAQQQGYGEEREYFAA